MPERLKVQAGYCYKIPMPPDAIGKVVYVQVELLSRQTFKTVLRIRYGP